MPKTKIELVVDDEMLNVETATLLRADAKAAVARLAEDPAQGLTVVRYLVESYYDQQQFRISSAHRARMTEKGDPKINRPGTDAKLLHWLAERDQSTEKAIFAMLDQYTQQETTGMGMWAQQFVGVGPIISAGLLATINMDIATTPSKVWRFFGLDPTVKWEKGKKRPWSHLAKQLYFKLGDSFVKFHNRDDCVFGKLYEQRKAVEVQRNENGMNAETARATLAAKNFKKEVRVIYEGGKLPDGRIELRARRWAVKIFLREWWCEAYRRKFKKEPPPPYPIEKLGHSTLIKVA
jgi:hypothetical protein